jgi:hypothetical protein
MIRFFWGLAVVWAAVSLYWLFTGAPLAQVGQALAMVGLNGAVALILIWIRERRGRRLP